MLAARAFADTAIADLIRIGLDAPSEGPRAHPLVRALGPSLETVFGLEHEALFPDDILALVSALRAGPLGDAVVSRETRPLQRCPERA